MPRVAINWHRFHASVRRLGSAPLPHAFSSAVEWTVFVEHVEGLLDFGRARREEAREREMADGSERERSRDLSPLNSGRDTRGGLLP